MATSEQSVRPRSQVPVIQHGVVFILHPLEDVSKELNIIRSPLAPLKKGGTKLLKVPLFKGDERGLFNDKAWKK